MKVQDGDWNTIIHLDILNCFNIGDLKSLNFAGGVLGVQRAIAKEEWINTKNVYNIGEVTGKYAGNIIGEISKYGSDRKDTKADFQNVYGIKEPFIGNGNLTSGSGTLKTKNEICSQAFVDLLNQNIGSNSDWKRWKLGEKGYPELDL